MRLIRELFFNVHNLFSDFYVIYIPMNDCNDH